MAEQTSWLTIEPGWRVEDRSGAMIGEVTAVVGDQDADIFDGLRFRAEDGEERYVRADRVGPIFEGRVTLEADLAEVDGDPADQEPGGRELRRDRGAEL